MVCFLLFNAVSLSSAVPLASLDHARRLFIEHRLDEALDVALEITDRADDATAAEALLLAAEIETARHRPEQAIDLLRRATIRAERARDNALLRESLEKTGALSLVNGRPGLALDVLRRHLEIVEESGEKRRLGRAHGLIGYALQKVGQYESALDHYRRAAELYRGQGGGVGEISSLLNIGTVQGEWLGYDEAAAKSFRRILDLTDKRDDVPPELTGLAWLNLAEALADGGRPAEALPCAGSGARIFERIDHRAYRARASAISARILRALHRPEEAERASAAALVHAERAGDADVRRMAHLELGHALAALGRDREAAVQFAAAADALEQLRRDIGVEEMQISFLRDKRETYEAWIAQLFRLHGNDPAGGHDAAALRASEGSRCRSFLDHLPHGGETPTAPEPLGLDGMRRILGPGRLLLEYFFGDERVYLFSVLGRTLSFVDLGPAHDLADRVAFAVDDLRSGRATESTAMLARRIVLDPLGGTFPEETSLLVVPDGPLFSLPFGALLETAGIDAPPIAYVPSATVLARTAGDAEMPTEATVLAVAVGDIDIDDPAYSPLGLADHEARRVASFFPDAGRRLLTGDVREADIRAALEGGVDVAHFAAHARIDEEDPGRSGLLLRAADPAGADDSDDGLLSAREVARLTIDARLVVLSGCTTSGSEVAPGEGVLGLGRAFLRAGASTVVVTLWDVSDVAAREVTDRFYEEASRGIPLDAALGRAVRRVDDLPDAAAFVLVGDGRTVLEGLAAPPRPLRRLAAAAMILAGLALLLFAWRARARSRRGAPGTAKDTSS